MFLVSGSRAIAAVKPTADDPLPDVYWARGTSLYTYWNHTNYKTKDTKNMINIIMLYKNTKIKPF